MTSHDALDRFHLFIPILPWPRTHYLQPYTYPHALPTKHSHMHTHTHVCIHAHIPTHVGEHVRQTCGVFVCVRSIHCIIMGLGCTNIKHHPLRNKSTECMYGDMTVTWQQRAIWLVTWGPAFLYYAHTPGHRITHKCALTNSRTWKFRNTYTTSLENKQCVPNHEKEKDHLRTGWRMPPEPYTSLCNCDVISFCTWML